MSGILWALSRVAVAQAPDLGAPFITSFETDQFGASGQNWVVVQDPRGVIYAGNSQGILEFDGQHWTLIPLAGVGTTRALASGFDGRIYYGAIGDFGFLATSPNGRLIAVSLKESLPPEARAFTDVWQVVNCADSVYFMTRERIFRFHDGKVAALDGKFAPGQACVLNHALFYSDLEKGVCLVDRERVCPIPSLAGLFKGKRLVMAPFGPHELLVARASGDFRRIDVSPLWDGMAGRYLPTRSGSGALDRTFPSVLAPFLKEGRGSVYKLEALGRGLFAAGTVRAGILLFDQGGKIIRAINRNSGLPDNTVLGLLKDRHENLWAATNVGISHIELSVPQSVFDFRNGIEGVGLSACSHRGRMYVGTFQGLYVQDPYRYSLDHDRPTFRAVKNGPDSIWEFREVGGVLLAASSHGLYRIRDAAAVRIFPGSLNSTSCLGTSRRWPGHLFVGTWEGVEVLDVRSDRWSRVGRLEGVEGAITSLVEDAYGDLWMATEANGLLRAHFDGSGPTRVAVFHAGPEEGLPDRSNLRIGLQGDTLLVCSHQGLYRATVFPWTGRSPDPTHFVPDLDLLGSLRAPSTVLHAMAPDGKGGVLISMTGGVAWISPREAGRNQPEHRLFLGLQPPEDSIFVHPDGSIWLPGKGLIRVDPGVAKNFHLPFQVLIRSAVAKGRRRGPAGAEEGVVPGGREGGEIPELPYSQNALSFAFSAPFFEKPGTIRFRFLLEGFDKDWSGWSATTFKEYTNIPGGRYRFRVQARNLYGTLGQEAVQAFRILPPWYRTWWAYGLYLLAFTGQGYGVVHWRSRKLEQDKRKLELKVRQRTEHLEKLNAIVKSINGKLAFDELLEAILRETRALSGAETAAALVRTTGKDTFRFHAQQGGVIEASHPPELSEEEAEARFVLSAREIVKDIFVMRGLSNRVVRDGAPHAKATLVVRIRIEGRVEGYFIFDDLDDAKALECHDLEMLEGLKEHFVSALDKARSIEDLKAAKEVAEWATRSKSQFLANMSHEIRTPLNAIIGFSTLGLKQEASPRVMDLIQKIFRAGQSLLGIVNDVLDFSKLEAGKLRLEQVTFRLPGVLRDVMDLFTQSCHEKGLQLILDLEEGVPEDVVGDPMRLRQILTNLLGNAVKFTSEGLVDVRVSIQGRDPEACLLRFSVQDSGIGMTREQQARLFRPFSQADASTTRKFGGTGLGLTISKRLVEMMGGHISLESVAGEGSTFTVILPFRLPAAGSHPRLRADLPAFGIPAAGDPSPVGERLRMLRQVPTDVPTGPSLGRTMRGMRVLVAEDNVINQEIAFALLQEAGLRVDVAANGLEAVEMVDRVRYDAVLLDVQMPEMDGYAAAREIRGKPAHQFLPIIAMTAHAMLEHHRECLTAGMNDIITKPIEPDRMFSVLDKWTTPRGRAAEVVPPPAPRPEASDGPFDTLEGTRRFGGARETYFRLLGEFACTEADAWSVIKRALEAGDRVAAERRIHSLKGAAGSLAAKPLFEAAAMLEEALVSDQPLQEKVLDHFQRILQDTLAAIQAHHPHP